MKDTYKEAAEVGEIKDQVSIMQDDILDIYTKNPKECKNLLVELSKINKELDELDAEYDILIKQL